MSALRHTAFALNECLASALGGMRSHPLRSFLTMLGMIIGVASVVCVVGLVHGLSESVSNQFRGLGASTLTLRARTSLEDVLRGKRNRLETADLDQLRYRIDGIRHVTPIVFAGERQAADVRNGPHTAVAQQFGTTASYQDVQQAFPREGRFLTASDEATRRRVVVLGEQVRRDLKLPDNPVGAFVQISGEWFKVVGVMEARGEMFGISQDNFVLVPYSTALALTGTTVKPDLWITFTIADVDQVENVKERVGGLIRRAHRIEAGKPDDFVVEASDTVARAFRDISTTITLVIAGIVGISLLVGGVGIMNIMLVSVTERTREIGISKALGAPRWFILLQFLVEAALLAVAGGALGVLVGCALAFGIAALIPNFPGPVIPWWAIAGACGFCGLVGIAFGMYPASEAAGLQPIDALRYE